MAIPKYSKRSDSLLGTREEYARNAAIMAECSEDDILVVKCKITEEQAREKVEAMIADDGSGMLYAVNFKLIEALRKANAPIVHKEYYSAITSYFHISEIEFDYSYTLKGDVINMSPKRVSANMDFCAAVETLDGRYTQSFNGTREPFDAWGDLLESECTDTFEEGFMAHKIFPEDSTRESKESMRILNKKLNARMVELVQEDLGKARRVQAVNIIDKQYSYVTKVLATPFYVFNYDLGNKIVTISVDAYSGRVNRPIVNNPLGLVMLSKTVEEPYFSIPICIVCGVAMIGLGAVLYALNYYSKKAKFNNSRMEDAPKYSFDELKELI